MLQNYKISHQCVTKIELWMNLGILLIKMNIALDIYTV